MILHVVDLEIPVCLAATRTGVLFSWSITALTFWMFPAVQTFGCPLFGLSLTLSPSFWNLSIHHYSTP